MGRFKRLRAYWDREWKIPRPDLDSVLFFFTINMVFLLWIGLSVFGVEAKAVKAAQGSLPESFFFANLFLAPLLGALAAGPLPIGRLLRLTFFVLLLCSGSLFIVTRQHQAAGLLMLGFIYLEAFWIVPRWNRWAGRKNAREGIRGLGEDCDGNLGARGKTEGSAKADRGSRIRDFALYILIACVIVTFILIHVLR